MNRNLLDKYHRMRAGEIGFCERKRGLIRVSGNEAVKFLNGLITNDVGKLEDGAQMSAAFPNAQGRLLALVRVRRRGEHFLFETEAETGEKVFKNLFRFTFAGDFYVEDLSDDFRYFEVQGSKSKVQSSNFAVNNQDNIAFQSNAGSDYFVPRAAAEDFSLELKRQNAVEITDDLDELLRIENGVPRYGVDADESTIVPELGIEDLISYQKGCYIGQEIIARIYFRGHIAKQLTGLILSDAPATDEAADNLELKSLAGKNAGRITSVTFSPKLEKHIALAFVRYDFLADGTQLKLGETTATVKHLPFVEPIG